MLRTNLSTRPFYNERIVHLLLGCAAVVVVVLTAFNAIRIIALSRQNTEFSALINSDRAEAQRLTTEAGRIRAGINQEELKATAQAADSANRLIDQRTFSWTEFFNRIEDTLPPEVMLTAVQPSFENERSVVQMTVLARRSEDIDEFIEKLEATGAFHDVLPVATDRTDEGMNRSTLRAVYSNAATEADAPADAQPPAKPAPSSKPSSPPAKRTGAPAKEATSPAPSPPKTGRGAQR
jgi:Tfp pilus assembly protein PilN